jgi:abortive infection bacteriophage resistance protein
MIPQQLNPEEQRMQFEERGIIFPDETHERDAAKIQEIGYYKLKEFAYSFCNLSKGGVPEYAGLSFKKLLLRYYQDKNFRIFMLHAIEDVEVRLNSVVAYQLGEKYGAFGYLDFKKWVNRKIGKFKIEEAQFYFKRDILKKISRSNLPDLRKNNNLNEDGFPTIWLVVDALTFGDTIHLLQQMSPSNLKSVADKFECTPKELVSWMKCMNFVRNACVHNSDLIDIHLRTKPTAPQEYAVEIADAPGGNSNAIAIAVFILKRLMNAVNPMYKFGNICDSLKKIVKNDESAAKKLGFESPHSLGLIQKRLGSDKS